jgi:hypothetical protein
MQPLDVRLMFALKTYITRDIDMWLANNPAVVITPHLISKLFVHACKKSPTMETSVNAFQKSGQCSYDEFIFRDYDFEIHSQHDGKNCHAASGSVIELEPGTSKCCELTSGCDVGLISDVFHD